MPVFYKTDGRGVGIGLDAFVCASVNHGLESAKQLKKSFASSNSVFLPSKSAPLPLAFAPHSCTAFVCLHMSLSLTLSHSHHKAVPSLGTGSVHWWVHCETGVVLSIGLDGLWKERGAENVNFTHLCTVLQGPENIIIRLFESLIWLSTRDSVTVVLGVQWVCSYRGVVMLPWYFHTGPGLVHLLLKHIL